MIENQHQYRATKAQLTRLEETLNGAMAAEATLQPALHRAMVAGLEAQVAELRQELDEYDSLRLGRRESRLDNPAS